MEIKLVGIKMLLLETITHMSEIITIIEEIITMVKEMETKTLVIEMQ
jgi:hypothetical protein